MKITNDPGIVIFKNNKTESFKATEALYSPKLQQPPCTHSSASISFVLSGNYLENFVEQAHSLQPSTLIFHPPQESNAVDFGSETVKPPAST